MNILQVNSSARSTGAQSSRLADMISARLCEEDPQATLVVRDLAREPHLILDEVALGALFTPAADRTEAQQARVALDDAAIAQIQAADVLVLGVPMYNFGIPAQLKAWLDAITRARVTFQYTPEGPQGLLTGKRAYIALARGGLYRGTEADSQVPYLKTILKFLGITDVHFIFAEGLALGAEAAQEAFSRAQQEIEAALASVSA